MGYAHLFLWGTNVIIIDNYAQVTAQIESERGVTKEEITDAIEQALVSACRKKTSEEANIRAHLDTETGQVKLYHSRTVVDKKAEDPHMEISKADARKINPKAKVGDEVETEFEVEDFGRIAAQTARQVIVQRIREAEKRSVYDEFEDKIGQMMTGTVQRVENRNYLINLGRIEALLRPRDQIVGEVFVVKEKVRIFVVGVERTTRGPMIHISRSNPGLLKRLFELEIPEIQDGVIEIKSVAREAGKRSKVAVQSHNPSIGAVGTCVGHMGGRIQSIIKELGNEKIDILEWDEQPRNFIANSLKPAKISQVIITDEDEKSAVVVVPKDQLSLAIGGGGINVRLAVKLTGWKIDILGEDEYRERSGDIKAPVPQLSLAEKLKLAKAELEKESEPTV